MTTATHAPVAALRVVTATRYVTPLREGGSLPGLLEADDDGLYVTKFSGAGQGPKALVAELLAGELGRALGLPVPEIVLVELDPALGKAEPDQEIQDLLERSPGLNLGIDFLPGALPFDPADGARPGADLPDPDLAADIVWFDGLIANVDRTPKNVNLLVWHGRLWLIDHGAALYVHFTWRAPAEHARRPFPQLADHVLLPYGRIDRGGRPAARAPGDRGRCSSRSSRRSRPHGSADGADTQRVAYVDYLMTRLEAPRPFVEEADRARRAT